MSVAILASASAFAGTPIQPSELPGAAQKFLDRHFTGDKVAKAEKEQTKKGYEFDVNLASGAEIEFRETGKWKEVKAAKGASVPVTLVPAAITKYVADNYAGQSIVEIARKRGGFQIELSNGTELKLTEEAQPLTADNAQKAAKKVGKKGDKKGSKKAGK